MMRRTSFLSLSLLLACGGTEDPGSTSVGLTFTSAASDEGAGDTSESAESSSESGSGDSQSGSADESADAGDGDASSGDGDSSSGDGDASSGDGDTTSGDGDGDASSGDGDSTSGDGDTTTSSGDGDTTTSSGDGDGDGSTSSTGDGDTTTSTSGDGDGDTTTSTSGDGDGDTTSTTTTSGDGDTTSGDGGSVEPCFEQNPNIEFVPPNLVFVLDKSGSMFGSSIDFGGGNIKSFWQILHETLMSVVMEREDVIKFGGNWFPTVHEPAGVTVFLPDSCVVTDNFLQVEPALNTSDDFLAALPAATATGSSNMVTPAQSGYDAATNWINSNIPSETTAMILFMDGVISDGTDGNPDCNMASPFMVNTVETLTANIATNAANGIPTYVVGFFLTDQSVVDEMNGYAQAGGVEAPQGGFYSATSPAALLSAFDQIAAEVASCDITLDVASPLPDDVEVIIGGVEYNQIDESQCASQAGWHYIGGDTTQIRLCQAACDAFTGDPASTVVNFYCDAG